MAVPDWPTTFGHNMFLYPWSKMIGGIFYEHSHRLVASGVGLLTIALVAIFWLKEERRWLRWLALGALALVIFQGVLGGLRVVLLQHMLAIVHACFAQAFFALTVSLALFTSKEWRDAAPMAPSNDGGRLRRLATLTTALIYLQIIFGAWLRHTGERLDAHLLFAALVAIHVVLLWTRISRNHGQIARLTQPAAALGLLLMIQILLGAGAYITKFTTLMPLGRGATVLIATTHLIIGALMLATSLILTLRARRLFRPGRAREGRTALKEQYSV